MSSHTVHHVDQPRARLAPAADARARGKRAGRCPAPYKCWVIPHGQVELCPQKNRGDCWGHVDLHVYIKDLTEHHNYNNKIIQYLIVISIKMYIIVGVP